MIADSTTRSAASSRVGARQPRGLVATLRAGRALNLFGLVLCAVAFSLPTIWLVLTSLKRESEYASYPITVLPAVPEFGNYVLAVTFFPYLTYVMHSVILAGVFTVLTVLTSSAAGFAFSRHRGVPGRDLLFGIVLATMMVPGLVTLVPQYMVFSYFHLINSYWPWILWGLSGSPFHIFLFRQFFLSIPRELEDAAEVDGCGKFRIFWQIFLPNSLPAVAASAIFSFTWVWGDWLYPSLFLSDDITTLAVKLATAYVDPHQNPLITLTMAGVVIYVLPMVIVFFLAQKYIIQGVVTTGLKG
ncbi:MAG: carbohydrate ABC transporter permease [Chloroflexota bacterium]